MTEKPAGRRKPFWNGWISSGSLRALAPKTMVHIAKWVERNTTADVLKFRSSPVASIWKFDCFIAVTQWNGGAAVCWIWIRESTDWAVASPPDRMADNIYFVSQLATCVWVWYRAHVARFLQRLTVINCVWRWLHASTHTHTHAHSAWQWRYLNSKMDYTCHLDVPCGNWWLAWTWTCKEIYLLRCCGRLSWFGLPDARPGVFTDCDRQWCGEPYLQRYIWR